MAFGKIASVKSVERPMAYRKIAQSYGVNNAFMPLLDDYIGSTLSNAHSASRVCMNLGHCYLVGLLWMYYYLLSTPEYNRLTDPQLITCALILSTLGGFPIIYLHNMYVRAESDLLSPCLQLYQFAIETTTMLGL